MIIRKEIGFNEPLTPEQLKMLEEIDKRPIVPDEDSPAYTKEELVKFKKMADQKREERQQSVTLHLSPQALEKAKSFGNGYTSILKQIFRERLK